MTATEAQALDLGQLAVVAEAFTSPDGPLAVEVTAIDELPPTPGAPGWAIEGDDIVVVFAPIGDPSPDLLNGLLGHFAAELGVAADDRTSDQLPPPVAASAVAVRAEDGSGLLVYMAPGAAPVTQEVAPLPDDANENGLITLGMLREVPLELSAELGRTRLSVAEILQLNVGSVVELDRAAGAPVDVVVNGSLIARGEVVVIDDEYGVRITEILGRVSDSL